MSWSSKMTRPWVRCAAGPGDQGYEVTLVDNGVDALVVFANGKLDVAVIDVMLPA